MGEVTNTENKLSYEELENVANNLYARLQQAEMSNMFKRLDYLFKVVKYSGAFTPAFVESCVAEIEEVLTIPAIPTEETKEA
jgi:hypothetical protein